MIKNLNNVTYGTGPSQTLDVYKPTRANHAALVWIHGGAFMFGSGSTPWYDGERFAQHGDVVGDREHLIEAMAHEQQRDPARAQLAQAREQVLHVVLGQRRRRLVEHQDAGVLRERTRDLDELALADAERRNRAQHAFVAALSHEMRTPLATLGGALQLLGESALPRDALRLALASTNG